MIILLINFLMIQTILSVSHEIHSVLGGGRRETVYQNCLREACAREHNIFFCTESVYPIMYKGYPVGFGRLDLCIPNELVVECKSVNKIGKKEIQQCVNYVRDLQTTVVCINFGPEHVESQTFTIGMT